MRYIALSAILLLSSCGVSESEPQQQEIQATVPRPEPAALASLKNCIACHNATGNMVGPSWQSIAQKYKGDPNAINQLTHKVLTGGSGSFGVVMMPPQASKLTSDEARYIVEWVLSHTAQ